MASRQKERALTSPKTSALAFISVLPWRINDGGDTTYVSPSVGCRLLVKLLRGCGKSFSGRTKNEQLVWFGDNEARLDLVKFTEDCAIWLVEIAYYLRFDCGRVGWFESAIL